MPLVRTIQFQKTSLQIFHIPAISQLFLLFIVFSVLPAWSQNVTSAKLDNSYTSPYKIKGGIDTLFLARDTKDKFYRTTWGALLVSPNFELEYTPWMNYRLGFSGYFATGTSSNFYTDGGAPPNTVGLDEATINLKPFTGLRLSGGALMVTFNPILSNFSPNTFLGTEEAWQIGADESNITIVGTQAIPSSGVTNRRLVDEGNNPYYLAESIQGTLKGSWTTLQASYTRFEFKNLSSNVATESYLGGNSLESFEGREKTLRFKSPFAGSETAVGIQQNLTQRLKINLKGAYIQNEQALPDRDQGQLAKVGLIYKYGNVIWNPSYTWFRVQDDVLPASYIWPEFRYLNREGGVSAMRVELEKQKLAFTAKYTRANEIRDNPYLADRDILSFYVEAKYDIF